jgi:long-chain acyl-CoA synthetase
MSSWEVPSVGPALDGTEVRVVTPGGEPAADGERGELLVRGHSTMAGYFEDLESTARTIDGEGWLRTGDEGFYRVLGDRPVYFITGRLKEIIIRDAEKYSPLRLERAIVEALPELSGRLVVLGFPHQEHGEEVGAYLQIEALDEPLRQRLTAVLRAMPVAERPKVVLHGSEPAPRTHTGKIQRRRMQPWFQDWAAHRGPLVIAARPDGASS